MCKISVNLIKMLLINAPRDEESKYLHEIYGVLEEIENDMQVFMKKQKIIKILFSIRIKNLIEKDTVKDVKLKI